MKGKTMFILEHLGAKIRCSCFQEANRLKVQSFIRDRIFTFSLVMFTIINQLSKSLSVELTKFLQQFCPGKTGSKQAFSKARYNIRWQAFEELNEQFMTDFYQIDPQTVRLWKDRWLLLATDGSDYELPWTDSLRKEFGVADNGQGKKPLCMGKGVKIWDVLNRMTLSAELGSYDIAEVMHFKIAWDKALKILHNAASQTPRLLMGDRHYPSFWLIGQLSAQNTNFLFRCPPTFCRETVKFIQTGLPEAVLTVPIASDQDRKRAWRRQTQQAPPPSVEFRILRIDTPDRVPYCLITNLKPQEATREELLELYPERWGEEVSFFFDKARFEVENFASEKTQGIKQEWYAQILAANMAQLLIEDAQERLNEEQKPKNNKHSYQINRSVAIGILKDELPKLVSGTQNPEQFYERILTLILAHREPVRKNRSFKRARSHKLKFSKNLRRVL
jgi:hypothetical protein